MRMKDLLDQLRRQHKDVLQLLETMVNMDSPSTDKALVDRFSQFVGGQFEAIGARVEFVHAERFGDHLVAKFDGPAPGHVVLLGHTDTVFSAGETARRPFRIEDGRAKGPGVFDMKAGIALMWSALKVLRPAPRPVTVLLTSDEELGSPSSRDLIERETRDARAVLVLEPSLPGGALKTSRKGSGRFTVKATGRAAHTGIDPEKGINAIEEIAHQSLAIQRMSNPDAGTTATVSMIHGGTRVNVVPAEAVLEVDVRVANDREAARITDAIRALQPCLPGASLQIRGGINRPPMEPNTDTAILFGVAREIAAEMGIMLGEGSTGGASDGNFTSAMGVPTLDGLGAIGHAAHSLDEFVEVDSLPERAALIVGLIERLK